MRLWISSPPGAAGGGLPDRIQAAGGSVLVSAAGAIAIAALAGQGITISGGTTFSNSATFNGTINTFAGVLTVNGLGTHTFSGPVKVGVVGNNLIPTFTTNITDAAGGRGYGAKAQDAYRFLLYNAANNDEIMYAGTGVAGSEVFTEALRIVNATGYVSVATRLGIGTATPSYPLHVVGNAQFASGAYSFGATVPTTGQIISVAANSVAHTAFYASQTAANATAPVAVVKLGATPDVGGDAQQWQNSAGAVLAKVDSIGGASFSFISTTSTVGIGAPANTTIGQLFVTTGVVARVLQVNRGMAGQTGDLFQAQDNTAAQLWTIGAAGHPKWASATLAQTTVGVAGAASALPATPTKYLQVRDSAGTLLVIPAYLA